MFCSRNLNTYLTLSFAVIMRKKTLCQFASPLDCDIHNKPEVSSYKIEIITQLL